MKFLKRALVASVAALALAIGPAVFAEAASMSFDVTKLSAANMVVSNDNCRYFSVYRKYKKDDVGYWTVDSEIAGRHGYTTDAYFGSYKNPSTKDRNMICPSLDGLGRYRIGPSEANVDNDYSWDAFTDHTKGYFYVRGKSYTSLSSKRKRYYRVTFSQVSWATGATSKSVKR
ncbi:hypothetical protein D3I60_15330 [Brevibacterium permense]|uniref:hypothetical protein n=1 Tax=Brevibacterium permense TaxID=234834 RepID=UPI0021D295C6|nr:hypothetical protein [Brevibacterium permense]MCU4298426.1 hypothetical protein [Brevibacterium permense]